MKSSIIRTQKSVHLSWKFPTENPQCFLFLTLFEEKKNPTCEYLHTKGLLGIYGHLKDPASLPCGKFPEFCKNTKKHSKSKYLYSFYKYVLDFHHSTFHTQPALFEQPLLSQLVRIIQVLLYFHSPVFWVVRRDAKLPHAALHAPSHKQSIPRLKHIQYARDSGEGSGTHEHRQALVRGAKGIGCGRLEQATRVHGWESRVQCPV